MAESTAGTPSGKPDRPAPLNFNDLWKSAIIQYEDSTGHKLPEDPFGSDFKTNTSVDEIISALKKRAEEFKDFRKSGRTFWTRMANVAQMSGLIIGAAGEVAAVMPGGVLGSKAIFTAMARLLQATRGVSEAYDAIETVLSKLEAFLKRLNTHFPTSDSETTPLIKDVFARILSELLVFIGLLIKYVDESTRASVGRTKKFMLRALRRAKDLGSVLLDKSEVGDALKRIDSLTNEELLATTASTHATAQKISGTVDKTAREMCKLADNQIDKDIRKWLDPPDPGHNYDRFRKERQPDTCEWIFDAKFEEWERQSNGMYWIHGNPGTGKSVLSSAVIKRLISKRALVAYFYFDFRDSSKQTIIGLLSSLVFQLAVRSELCYGKLKHVHAQNQSLLHPNEELLTECLANMLDSCDETFIILDALDECPEITRNQDLLPFLENLRSRNIGGLRLLATSRLEKDIKASLTSRPITSLNIHDKAGHSDDIVRYIEQELARPAYSEWPQHTKDVAREVLSSKAGGMFLWVNLQLQMLRGHQSIDVEDALGRLPATLDETYQRILERLAANMLAADRTRLILRCVAFARRALRSEELAEVFAIDFRASDGPILLPDHRPKNPADSLLVACPGLLQIVETARHDGGVVLKVQFVHFTVQEYLFSSTLPHNLRSFALQPESAHATLAQACLAAIASSDSYSPLQTYAFYNLSWHARQCPDDEDVERLFSRVLHPDNFERSSLHSVENWHWQPLCWAAKEGLVKQIEFLLDLGSIDIDAVNSTHTRNVGTALCAAVSGGHLEAVELLIGRRASVEIGGERGPPLHLAAEQGNTEILALLLDRGACIDACGPNGRTALHQAAERKSDGAITLLLARGLNVDVADEHGRTPLHYASLCMSVSSARLLLENNAAVDARDQRGRTPLHLAPAGYPSNERAASDLISLLLEHGASLDSCDEDGNTPLHVAAMTIGSSNMIHALLKHGAKVDVVNHHGRSPFYLAAKGGNLNGVRLLLEWGASSRTSPSGWTILHEAALPFWPKFWPLSKNLDFLAHLRRSYPALYLAFDVEARSDCGQTGLSIASALGDEHRVRDFLELGANVNAADSNGFRAIDYAAARGHVDAIRLLLEHGADGWTESGPCGTYIGIAARTHRANELRPEDWEKKGEGLCAGWERRSLWAWPRHMGKDLGDLVAGERSTAARGERMMRRVRRYRSIGSLSRSDRSCAYILTIDGLREGRNKRPYENSRTSDESG